MIDGTTPISFEIRNSPKVSREITSLVSSGARSSDSVDLWDFSESFDSEIEKSEGIRGPIPRRDEIRGIVPWIPLKCPFSPEMSLSPQNALESTKCPWVHESSLLSRNFLSEHFNERERGSRVSSLRNGQSSIWIESRNRRPVQDSINRSMNRSRIDRIAEANTLKKTRNFSGDSREESLNLEGAHGRLHDW